MKSTVLPLFLAAAFSLSSQAKVVTLIINDNPSYGPVVLSNEIVVAESEIAEAVNGAVCGNYFELVKGGYTFQPLQGQLGTVAGPCVIRFRAGNLGCGPSFCTVRVSPESFPPDKTLIIPEGTGANVTFECSTNLLDWNPVWQGAYTNSPSNKFFRIRADRIQ